MSNDEASEHKHALGFRKILELNRAVLRVKMIFESCPILAAENSFKMAESTGCLCLSLAGLDETYAA